MDSYSESIPHDEVKTLCDLFSVKYDVYDVKGSLQRCINVKEVSPVRPGFGPHTVDKVTRLEVIDEHGRKYTRWDCQLESSFQDGGRTLKLFVTGTK